MPSIFDQPAPNIPIDWGHDGEREVTVKKGALGWAVTALRALALNMHAQWLTTGGVNQATLNQVEAALGQLDNAFWNASEGD